MTWVLPGVAGPPGLDRAHRRDLSRPRAADERRHRHPALGEERLLAAESGAEHTDPVHFVQMWVVPDERRDHAGLRAAGDRPTSCCPADSSRWLPAWPSTTAQRRSGSRTGTPRCTSRGCSLASGELPGRPVPSPVRGSRRLSSSRAPVRLPAATPYASRRSAASESRRPHPPRSSSGRCTRRSLPERSWRVSQRVAEAARRLREGRPGYLILGLRRSTNTMSRHSWARGP